MKWLKSLLAKMFSALATPGEHHLARPPKRDKKLSYEQRLRDRRRRAK